MAKGDAALVAGAAVVLFAACAREEPPRDPELVFPTFEVVEPWTGSREHPKSLEGHEASMRAGLDMLDRPPFVCGSGVMPPDFQPAPGLDPAHLPGAIGWPGGRWFLWLDCAFAALESMVGGPWTVDEVRVANLAADLLRRNERAPSLRFREGERTANEAELLRLIDWFRAEFERPEFVAALAGCSVPYVGLPVDAAASLVEVASRSVSEQIELRLLRPEEPGGQPERAARAFLRCVVEGEIRWTRELSAKRVAWDRLRFADDAVTRIGPYGSLVRLRAWTPVDVYLDPAGELLFYRVL